MKIKGLGLGFGRILRGVRQWIGRGCSSGGGQIGSVASVWARGGSTGAMRRVFGRAASVPAGCRRVAGAAGVWDRLLWARVTDVAKRRRQGLVVCRAALPFEGLFDARPGVTLAPTFVLAWAGVPVADGVA